MEQPHLTETEYLRLENIALKHRMTEAQLQALLLERAQVIKQIEDRLPGWMWRDPEGLVERPGPVAVEADPTAGAGA